MRIMLPRQGKPGLVRYKHTNPRKAIDSQGSLTLPDCTVCMSLRRVREISFILEGTYCLYRHARHKPRDTPLLVSYLS